MDYKELKEELISISEILKNFPDNLQETVYNTLISKLDENLPKVKEVKNNLETNDNNVKNTNLDVKSNNKKKIIKSRAKTNKNSKTYNYLNDLDLYSSSPKFTDFIANKKITSNVIFNVVSVCYLQDILKIDDITIDHIYTCYRITRRAVGNLNQSLTDTCSARFGYILRNDNKFKMTSGGYNLIQELENDN